ncbi:hypothetical protein ISN44_As09g015700 [Arabidopsis suecica]|uniref:Uncharacterized protein n=1 Tax=Arabidopsis suecica TaxID=45249 RepID=A0A8T2AHL6_ARASU|nr:hypothetical protein ISN44_As09g015700 [Arabidopsis suecica]
MSRGPSESMVNSGEALALHITNIQKSLSLNASDLAPYALQGYALFFDKLGDCLVYPTRARITLMGSGTRDGRFGYPEVMGSGTRDYRFGYPEVMGSDTRDDRFGYPEVTVRVPRADWQGMVRYPEPNMKMTRGVKFGSGSKAG